MKINCWPPVTARFQEVATHLNLKASHFQPLARASMVSPSNALLRSPWPKSEATPEESRGGRLLRRWDREHLSWPNRSRRSGKGIRLLLGTQLWADVADVLRPWLYADCGIEHHPISLHSEHPLPETTQNAQLDIHGRGAGTLLKPLRLIGLDVASEELIREPLPRKM
jgi:hypothetical protein